VKLDQDLVLHAEGEPHGVGEVRIETGLPAQSSTDHHAELEAERHKLIDKPVQAREGPVQVSRVPGVLAVAAVEVVTGVKEFVRGNAHL
tara:strand:+ start:2309 stop:2575 length:267 start_codon:yes stop_codon:yes gene_type:complete